MIGKSRHIAALKGEGVRDDVHEKRVSNPTGRDHSDFFHLTEYSVWVENRKLSQKEALA